MKSESTASKKRCGMGIMMPAKSVRNYENQIGKKSKGPYQGTQAVKK